MRLWTVHPKYMDPPGLTGLWREGLLAQAVLAGDTIGYKNHPQLSRFISHPSPLGALALYLTVVYEEAKNRGYRFDPGKINSSWTDEQIQTTRGQLAFEWRHLLHKLKKRNPQVYQKIHQTRDVAPNPLFEIIAGDVEPWEKR